MKRIIFLFLLLVSSAIIMGDACYAQSLDLLTGLHPRPQVSYFLNPNRPTTIRKDFVWPWTILYDADASTGTLRAIDYLQRTLKSLIGDTLLLDPITRDTTDPVVFPDSNIIIIGEKDFRLVQSDIQQSQGLDSLKRPESYFLSVDSNRILIAGADTNGTFYAVSTLAQLIANSGNNIPSLHIYDWPDYPIRWVFSTHNLLVTSQLAALEAIEDSMAAHKLNGLQQNDFKNNIYDVFENPNNPYPQYFYNVDSLQAHSEQTNVELIPGLFPMGWSEGILFHDPELAEGIPTTTSYYIQDDTGKLLTDPRMILPNGGFENVSNGQFTGWNFYDGPKVSTFVDSTTVHSGKYSARCTNFVAGNASGNCRFERAVLCQPFHGYHMSVWIKTQNFQGSEVQLLAIAHHGSKSQSLTFTQFSVPSTSNGWNKYNVVFNTLTYDSLYVYCGVWGGTAGTIWFDDFNIEDAGMTNLLRRADDMPVVMDKFQNCVEGRDYSMLVDTIMEQKQGTYPWHASPVFHVLLGSKIKNGDTVDVNFIRPNPTINDASGDGSTMVCVSEDSLYSILHDQMSRVDAQYHANKYFMSHDEIREMNWDNACQRRKLSAAQLLADNVRKCDSIMHEVHPGAEVFDWSDMFDSLHNAHNNYYLVNGDLSGDWNLIPKDITIVNWNGGNMSQSLNFFSKLGFSQITSPYYDVQNTDNIRAWRLAMDTIPNMRGMMYTTWANDYGFLTPFADYAWSAGPMIVHRPLTNSTLKPVPGGYDIEADVFPDPYDPTDSIVSVVAFESNCWDVRWNDTLRNVGGNHFQGMLHYPCEYKITAVNKQELTRSTPRYSTGLGPERVSQIAPKPMTIILSPNPTVSSLTLRRTIPSRATILIEDLLGREVARFETSSASSILDLHNIPAGIYECIVTDASGTRAALPFVKQ